MGERRAHPRAVWDGQAEARLGLARARCRGVDLSADGMQLTGCWRPQPGQSAWFDFAVGDQRVRAQGVVMWSTTAESGFRWGVRFTDLQDTFSEIIGDYIGTQVPYADEEPPTLRRVGEAPQPSHDAVAYPQLGVGDNPTGNFSEPLMVTPHADPTEPIEIALQPDTGVSAAIEPTDSVGPGTPLSVPELFGDFTGWDSVPQLGELGAGPAPIDMDDVDGVSRPLGNMFAAADALPPVDNPAPFDATALVGPASLGVPSTPAPVAPQTLLSLPLPDAPEPALDAGADLLPPLGASAPCLIDLPQSYVGPLPSSPEFAALHDASPEPATDATAGMEGAHADVSGPLATSEPVTAITDNPPMYAHVPPTPVVEPVVSNTAITNVEARPNPNTAVTNVRTPRTPDTAVTNVEQPADPNTAVTSVREVDGNAVTAPHRSLAQPDEDRARSLAAIQDPDAKRREIEAILAKAKRRSSTEDSVPSVAATPERGANLRRASIVESHDERSGKALSKRELAELYRAALNDLR